MAQTEIIAWPTAWSRTALPTAILAVLSAGECHGYLISTELEGRGFGRPRGGSLYPLLGRLEEDGLITSTWQPSDIGPGRRTYRLTAQGAARLDRERAQWAALVTALTADAATEHDDGPVTTGAQGEGP